MLLLGNKSVERIGVWTLCLAGVLLLAGCVAPPPEEEDFDPPEQTIGERLFLETRFAEYFAANMTDINAPLAVGDPVVNQVQNANGGPMAGPFAGQSINCRTCHFVDEFQGAPNAGNRTYADFTDHSPIPRAAHRVSQHAAQRDADGRLAANTCGPDVSAFRW